MDIVNNPGLNAVCATVTCCGTILDYKSNFQGGENKQSHPEQGDIGNDNVASSAENAGKNKSAWVLAIWRVFLWGVAFFNFIMDCIFIGSLYTDKNVQKTYAHLMLGTSLLSLVSETFVYGPLINEYIKIIRDWKDRLDVLTLCFVSALVCYWVEDVTTIYLYFKVDGVYDTENIADVINLFSSIIAGCISLVSLVILPLIILAARFGAFDQESTCYKRCSAVFACCLFISSPTDNPQRVISEEEKKERNKRENIMIALVVIAIIATVYPSYVAIFQIYLNQSVGGDDLISTVDVVCEDSDPFYSYDVQSRVRCDWIDISACNIQDIREHC
jgi:Accessory gene regulator B.